MQSVPAAWVAAAVSPDTGAGHIYDSWLMSAVRHDGLRLSGITGDME